MISRSPAIVLLAAFVVLASFAAVAQQKPTAPAKSAAGQSMTGVVTDTMCGKMHMLPGKTDAECTKECVKNGSKYALMVGDKMYTLNADNKKLEPFAGKKVKITGDMKGDTVTVAAIEEAK